jgi:choline/glycine/proline betaine transport protein
MLGSVCIGSYLSGLLHVFSRTPLTIRSIFLSFFEIKFTVELRCDRYFAVLATVFGLATSLGLGVQQIAAGLEHLFDIDSGVQTQVILIAE